MFEMNHSLQTSVAAIVIVLMVGFCVHTSSASTATFIVGVLVGVAVGRMSKTRPSQGKGLFESEGWEGSADVSDWEPFRGVGRSMIDYIANYYRNIESFPVRAQVEPGYLRQRLTQKGFPLEGEKWSNIMADVDNHIMPGITHWQHPRFFAWYPANSSPAAILGDLLAGMFNIIGFSWEASPAATELEVLVLDQLGRAIGLPEVFLSGGEGGAVMQGSMSEATLAAMLAAKMQALKHMRRVNPGASDHDLLSRMTLYTSDQAHSSVQKASNIAGLGANLRIIPTRGNGSGAENPYALDAADVFLAMKEDMALGWMPIFVSATMGTTNTCAIDPLRSLAQVCRSCAENGSAESAKSGFVPWLHVDAAYAGSAAMCPENRWILDGIEGADSFAFSLHKWMLANFECSAMWVKRSAFLVDALKINQEIVEYQRGKMPDFSNWQVPMGRKFRSLKIWMIMRAFGLNKIRAYIRRHVRLAGDFEKLVKKDDRFEIVAPPRFGLVCFRLKGSDVANQELKSRIISTGLTFLSSTKLEGQTCLRLCVGCPSTGARHVQETWEVLSRMAEGF